MKATPLPACYGQWTLCTVWDERTCPYNTSCHHAEEVRAGLDGDRV